MSSVIPSIFHNISMKLEKRATQSLPGRRRCHALLVKTTLASLAPANLCLQVCPEP